MIKNTQQHSGTRSGFTLLELIVSISILALMALLIVRIFSESSRAVDQGQKQALLDETARLVLDNIEQDVSQALIRTNVAFRVYDTSANEALYFVSTGIRRNQETTPRDTGPQRIYTAYKRNLISELNHYIKFEYAVGFTDSTAKALKSVIKQSDYYKSRAVSLGGEAEYTAWLQGTDGVTDHASLTFLSFTINGNPASNGGRTNLPTLADFPRFVDVSIGLVSSKEMQHAMRIYTAQSLTQADEFLQKRERTYTRRIFMRNTGTEALIF